MPLQAKHLTKKQMKAKKIAEKICEGECDVYDYEEIPTFLTDMLILIMVGVINKEKDWTETAEYQKDLEKATKKIPKKITMEHLTKMSLANTWNTEFMISTKNLAYYYRLNLQDFRPCIILTPSGEDKIDYLDMFKTSAKQRWVEGNGKKGALGFFYNRTSNDTSAIDEEKHLKIIADEMCSQMPNGCNLYKHNHTINGEVFYGVGIANENYSQDRFAMSIFRHMVCGYTWYFHDEYDQQQLINRFLENKNPPNYINCCEEVSENDID